jgi:tetratricopeptide (TPR) repeat protein
MRINNSPLCKILLSICLICWSVYLKAEQTELTCALSKTTKNFTQVVSFCEKLLNNNKVVRSEKEMLDIYFTLTELNYQLGNGNKQDYYLSKIKSLPSYLLKVEYQYNWNRKAGQRYFRSSDLDNAGYYFYQAFKIALSEDNPDWKSKSYNDVGLIEFKKNNFRKSLSYYRESLLLKQKLGDLYSIAKTLTNIGYVYAELEEHTQAILYYQKAHENYLEYANIHPKDQRIHHSISHLYEYFANSYVAMDNKESSDIYLQKMLSTLKHKLSARQQSQALISIAKVFNKQKKYDEQKLFLERAMALSNNKEFNHIIEISLQMIQMHQVTNKIDQAISIANRGLIESERIQDELKIANFHKILSQLYRNIDDALALKYLEHYQNLREKFFSKKYHSDLKTIQHQMEKQVIAADLVIEQLANAKHKSQIQNLTIWSLIAAILFLLSIAFIGFYYIKKNKERKYLLRSIDFHKQQLLLLNSEKSSFDSQNQPQETIDKHENFKHLLVNCMIEIVYIWEQHTGKNKIELAEKSKLWTISIDNGTLRTRSLDKYLTLDKIPKNPKWRNVVKTCHFVLLDSTLNSDKRVTLNNHLNKVMEAVKELSLNA